jgi:uncharacterized protein (TIGR03000 family)
MSQKAFAFCGLWVIAVAVVLWTVEPGQAAPHGGGFHGGGFHGGVVHGGVVHSGVVHSGVVHSGVVHGGGFHAGAFNHGGFVGGGFHRGEFFNRGFFGGGYYPGYSSGYYPSYNYYPSSGYDPSYNYSPSYDYSPYPYGLGYGDTAPSIPDGGTGTVTSQSFYAPPTGNSLALPAVTDTEAHLIVNVPTDADLWFNGSKVTSAGSAREFHSSPLSPGRYSYEIRARWAENGHDVTQTQTVIVTPGEHVKVNFPDPSGIK